MNPGLRSVSGLIGDSLILRWCHNAHRWIPYCQSRQVLRSTAFVRFKQSRSHG
jgi:hypothetical protein